MNQVPQSIRVFTDAWDREKPIQSIIEISWVKQVKRQRAGCEITNTQAGPETKNESAIKWKTEKTQTAIDARKSDAVMWKKLIRTQEGQIAAARTKLCSVTNTTMVPHALYWTGGYIVTSYTRAVLPKPEISTLYIFPQVDSIHISVYIGKI